MVVVTGTTVVLIAVDKTVAVGGIEEDDVTVAFVDVDEGKTEVSFTEAVLLLLQTEV